MMNRKEFINQCVRCSVGMLLAPAALLSCSSTKYVNAPIVGSELMVNLTEFEIIKDGITQHRPFVVVQHESLQYPICVYRNSPESYDALWMKCTHQGTELHVYGDRLQCPAHGSEFTKTGAIQNGPADKPLRSFVTTVDNSSLKIKLQ